MNNPSITVALLSLFLLSSCMSPLVVIEAATMEISPAALGMLAP
jgi:hypothetical protein